MKGNALLGMAAIALAAGMGAGDAAEDALRSDKGKPQAKTINVKVARKEAPAVRMIDNYNEGGITFDIEAANPGKDKFKQKSGKIISSKPHNGQTWAQGGCNTEKEYKAKLPATAPSSNVGSLPNEPIYVLCSGEWDDSTNAGKGGKGSKRDFKNVWLAELSGKECVRLFICHQDREGDVSAELVDRVYHNSLRKDTVNNTAKQYGKDNKNSIVVTVGNTTTTSLKDKKFADMLELGKNLPELLNGKKLVAVYSAGHGVRGTYRDFDENQKPMGKEKTMVKLRIGRSSPDGKKTVASPLNKEKIEWYRFDRNAIDEKTNLQPSEFVGIFKDFLDDGATIYLYHCYSAYIVSDFREALNGMNANVVGMSGKSQIGGDKPLRPNNGRGIAGHVLAVSHNTDNP